jgi:nucleoside-diphosphate-sugar epimerase
LRLRVATDDSNLKEWVEKMKIFLVGASGYIGGTIARRLQIDGHQIRGLARSKARAAVLVDRDIEPIMGSLDDASFLAQAAQTSDAVINVADSDHRPSVAELVRALSGSGKKLIHTSGSAIISTDSNGEPTSAVFDEDTLLEPRPEWTRESRSTEKCSALLATTYTP